MTGDAIERADEPVLRSRSGPVAIVTLNRPSRKNAMTSDMRNSYLRALRDAGSDDTVGAVVVTGAGGSFCAGADFEALTGLDSDELSRRQAEQEVPFDIALSLPKPVIAAIDGAVAGIGFAHALMADIRIATPEAFFVTAFSRLGLVAEGGLSWLLPRLVGSSRALDLLWTSRRCTADEALEMGLVNSVVDGDVLDAAIDYATALVDGASAHSLAVMKQQVRDDWACSHAEALARSKVLVAESLDRPEFAERVAQRRAGKSA